MPSPTSLSPGFCRITYSGELFPHHMTVPVNYDGTPTPGVNPTLIAKGGDTPNGIDAVQDLVTVLQPVYTTETRFGLAEFHTIDSVTGEDQFIYGFDLALLGTNGAARQAMEQAVMTFKTTLGGMYRLYFMETYFNPNYKELTPFAEPALAGVAAYATGDDSIIYGRGNAYPFAAISFISKTNDALRKQQGNA